MEEQFERIRNQVDSKLDNQKQIAITLIAVEETIRDQNSPLIPTAYFAVLLTTLEEHCNSPTGSENEIHGAILYLLNIILPNISPTILLGKFSQIMPILLQDLESNKEDSAIVRSITGCMESFLIVQDRNTWNQLLAKKSFQALLILSVDQRPKPRKRAQDAVRKILNCPPPPMVKHPVIGITTEFCQRILNECLRSDRQSVHHTLTLLKAIAGKWPVQNLGQLCELLLKLQKSNDALITIATYQVFDELFQYHRNGFENYGLEELLKSHAELMPNIQDTKLLPHWLTIIAKGFKAYAEINSDKCVGILHGFFKAIFPVLEVNNSDIRIATTNCLVELITHGITDDVIQETLRGGQVESEKKQCLNEIILIVKNGFNFRYQTSWSSVLKILESLFQRLKRSSQKLLGNLLIIVEDIRMNSDSELKDAADKTLGAAITNMGPQAFLNVLPLNLETPDDNQNIGRAWLLPLLEDYITNTELDYFIREFVPLSERLSQKSLHFQNQSRMIEAKIYETLVQQLWALLPGFCDLPLDLPHAFTNVIAEMFNNMMYQKLELRPIIVLALENLVKKNRAIMESNEDNIQLMKKFDLDKTSAEKNLQFLAKYATNFLAVFFNIFSQTPTAYSAYILNAMKVYLTITPAKDISITFDKVLNLLKQSLSNHTPQSNERATSTIPSTSYTMLDLSIVMVPYLEIESGNKLYEIITALFCNEDPTLQKKAYKALYIIAENDNIKSVILQNIDDLQNKLIESAMVSTPAAKKNRLLALMNIIKLLPRTDLHMIPDVLSEAILSTKEISEKARIAAYELLITMGNKMKEGGTIIMSKVAETDPTTQDVDASINEFVFKMVVAGLAANTPHMISATIASLSRLLFEFKFDIDQSLLHQLLDTIDNFVKCTNREIVKATLGFVKVVIISLDVDFLVPHLPQIILGILTWSNGHRSFKFKVRHILERLIQRFGYETIEKHVPESDRKLLSNIRKKKNRAKHRKKMDLDSNDETQDKESTTKHKSKSFMSNSSFEDVLYGSESDFEISDQEEEIFAKIKPSNIRSRKAPVSWIDEDEDEDVPIDCLDESCISKVFGSNPSIRKTSKHNASLFNEFNKTKDGRIIVDESDDESLLQGSDADMKEAENNYSAAQRSSVSFTRGQRSKVKFNKGQKDNDMDLDIIEPIDAIAKRNKKNKSKRNVITVGREYKAEKAEGDVKRKGKPDPYAYVPLTSMYRKKGQKGIKISLTKGKVKKRRAKKLNL
ncbi:putative nucleolar protein [Gigaspora margarita]|uniref:Putative nucleolar protein n=2 Tax=Gigaspora margarita TaxID=4874 RepID=A0A8H3XJI5_GIGMA|nr:putative nucleolar protein [Gigaspora margarita]